MVESMGAFLVLIALAAYRDVKFSSRAALILEGISVGILIVIIALIVRVKGTVVDPVQLDLTALKYAGVFSALPFVMYCLTGFESAATLAKESANPRRNIPIAVVSPEISRIEDASSL
jgi:amino acid transporter